jgi:hypothetical protein
VHTVLNVLSVSELRRVAELRVASGLCAAMNARETVGCVGESHGNELGEMLPPDSMVDAAAAVAR